ncbi:MAG: hypothetical protein IT355_06620 [Gemmatimonadaceae bacterium]|nr:hypothetical protein [Gemmatimonadaceae bacterium]
MPLYYYAGGTKHPLERVTDRVVLDARAAAHAGVTARVTEAAVHSRLPGGLQVVSTAGMADGALAALRSAGALQPVFRSGKTLVILLPEVRVELEPGQQDAVLAAVRAADVASEVTESTDARVSLRPVSGLGEDALRLANFICETAHPAAATARMLTVMARPMVRK